VRAIVEHVRDLPGGAAAGEPGLADIGGHKIEGGARTVLHVAQCLVAAIDLLVGEEHAGDAADHDQAEQHGDHQFDQGEALLPTAHPQHVMVHRCLPAHSMALVVKVCTPVVLPVPAAPDLLSSKTMVMVQTPVLPQLIVPVVLAAAPSVLASCPHHWLSCTLASVVEAAGQAFAVTVVL